MSDNSYIGPEQKYDTTQGAAEGGLVPSESELPIVPNHGGPPASTGGYSPSPAQQPLPAPGSTTGDPLPPSGNRK